MHGPAGKERPMSKRCPEEALADKSLPDHDATVAEALAAEKGRADRPFPDDKATVPGAFAKEELWPDEPLLHRHAARLEGLAPEELRADFPDDDATVPQALAREGARTTETLADAAETAMQAMPFEANGREQRAGRRLSDQASCLEDGNRASLRGAGEGGGAEREPEQQE